MAGRGVVGEMGGGLQQVEAAKRPPSDSVTPSAVSPNLLPLHASFCLI